MWLTTAIFLFAGLLLLFAFAEGPLQQRPTSAPTVPAPLPDFDATHAVYGPAFGEARPQVLYLPIVWYDAWGREYAETQVSFDNGVTWSTARRTRLR